MTFSARALLRSGEQLLQVLSLVFTIGCSGKVDLGGPALATAPKPTTHKAEIAAATESILTLKAEWITGLAADAHWLYLTSFAENGTDAFYLQRCAKSDCWSSLTTLGKTGRSGSSLFLQEGRLGWVNDDGLTLCHTPACQDPTLIDGAVFAPGSHALTTWADSQLYWWLPDDSSIYTCTLSDCAATRKIVVTAAVTEKLLLLGDFLYLHTGSRVLRTSRTAARQLEELSFSDTTAWKAAELSLPQDLVAADMDLDDAWLYVATSPTLCTSCEREVTLMRWRLDEPSAVAEQVLGQDATLDALVFIRVFDGEIVWSTTTGDLWSCRAENCQATKRQMGVQSNVASGQPRGGESVVGDAEFIYWLSTPNPLGDKPWNLKRTPRLPH